VVADHRRNPVRLGTQYPDQANIDLLSRISADARTVLDVGCGTGALGAAYRVLNSGARLLGVEHDPEMAAIARQRLDAVACVDVQQNPLPFELSEGIDCLIYGDVLQQLRDPWTVLRRQLEVLNPGGSVLVCIANAEHWSIVARLLRGNWHYEPTGLLDVRHLRWFSLRTVMRELVDAGLAVEEVHPRIFAPEQAQQFVQTLAPGLRRLGIDPGVYLRRAMPLQYVMRARRAGLQTTTASAVEPAKDKSEGPILEEEALILPSTFIAESSNAIDNSAMAAAPRSDGRHTLIVAKDTSFVSRSLLSMTETVDLERLRDTPFSRAVLAPAGAMDMPPCYVMNPPSAPLSLSDTPHNRIFPQHMPHPEMWVARLDDVYYSPYAAPFLPNAQILINDYLLPESPNAVEWFRYEGDGNYTIPIDLDEVHCVDTAFFMGHPMSSNFGHFVGDWLSRMHAWQDCRNLFGDVKIILDHTHDTILKDKLLARIGVNAEDIVFAQGVVHCRKLLFASAALSVSRYASPTSAKLWRQIRDALAPFHAEGAERIYLSASSQSAPKLVNGLELENVFRNFGFVIVRPEDLPLEEQISMVLNAQLIAGPVGSAMFNLAFQRRLKSALILLPETFVHNAEWLFLAGTQCPVYYHFGVHDIPAGSPVSAGDAWRVDVSRLAADVASWLWAGSETPSPCTSLPIEDRPAASQTQLSEPKVAIQSASPLASDAKGTIDRNSRGALQDFSLAGQPSTMSPAITLENPAFQVAYPEIVNAELIPYFSRHAMEEAWKRDSFEASPLNIYQLDDAYVVHEALVFDRDLCVLPSSTYATSEQEIAESAAALREALQSGQLTTYPNPTVALRARATNNYGHYLLEMFPRAFIARQLESERPVDFLIHRTSAAMLDVAYQSLSLIGVGLDRIVVTGNEPTHFRRLIALEGISRHGKYMSPLAVAALGAMAATVPQGNEKRLFVSRATAGHRRLLNEDELSRALAKVGYVTVDTNGMSLTDQITLFSGAERVIGPLGAAMANIAFCEPGTKVALLAPCAYPDTFFWFIAMHKKHHYVEVRCEQQRTEGPEPWKAGFVVRQREIDYLLSF